MVKPNLPSFLQRLMPFWPLVAAAAVAASTLVGGAFASINQLNKDTGDIADTKARVDKLENRLDDMREDIAVTRAETQSHTKMLEHIEDRLDAREDKRK